MIVLATARAEPPLADELIERWATEADKAHAASRKGQAARYHSLLARAGIRALLFSHTARNDWQLSADARGKLSAFDEAGREGPAISVAHSRGMIVCGLTTIGALGVDIEAHRPRAFDPIAVWSFGQEERSAVQTGRAAAFYRIWTLREAMGKATGEGLALATDGRDRTGGPDEGLWRKRIAGQDWLLAHYRLDTGFSLAIATLLDNLAHAAEALPALHWVDLMSIGRTGADT